MRVLWPQASPWEWASTKTGRVTKDQHGNVSSSAGSPGLRDSGMLQFQRAQKGLKLLLLGYLPLVNLLSHRDQPRRKGVMDSVSALQHMESAERQTLGMPKRDFLVLTWVGLFPGQGIPAVERNQAGH